MEDPKSPPNMPNMPKTPEPGKEAIKVVPGAAKPPPPVNRPGQGGPVKK